jgi:hypothetical protein
LDRPLKEIRLTEKDVKIITMEDEHLETDILDAEQISSVAKTKVGKKIIGKAVGGINKIGGNLKKIGK